MCHRKTTNLVGGRLKPICFDPAGTPGNLLKKIFLSETNSRTSKSRHLAQCARFLLLDHCPWPLAQNGSTLSLEKALPSCFMRSCLSVQPENLLPPFLLLLGSYHFLAHGGGGGLVETGEGSSKITD